MREVCFKKYDKNRHDTHWKLFSFLILELGLHANYISIWFVSLVDRLQFEFEMNSIILNALVNVADIACVQRFLY